MRIYNITGVYVGLMRVTGRPGGFYASGQTRLEVINKLLKMI